MSKALTFKSLKVTVALFIILCSTVTYFNLFIISKASPGFTGLRVDPPNLQDPYVNTYGPFTISPGQEVLVNVTVENVEDLWGYRIELDYDSTILSFEDLIVHHFLNKPYSVNKTVSAGSVMVEAESREPATPVSGTGQLFTVVLKGLKVGDSNLPISNAALWMKNGTSITSSLGYGYVAVSWTNIAISPHQLSGNINDTVTANIVVSNVTDLYGIQFNVTWDPTILKLTKVDINLPWSNFFQVVNSTMPGEYELAYTAMPPATPHTGRNWTFTTLQFKILKTGLTILNIHNSKLSDTSAEPISHAEIDGIFSNVQTTISITPSQIIDSTAIPGTTVDFNVTIEKVAELHNFIITVEYNPNVLVCTKIDFIVSYQKGSNETTVDNVLGTASSSASLVTPVTGNLTVITLHFNVTKYSDTYLVISLSESQLLDVNGQSIPFNAGEARFINWRNVAVTSLGVSSSIIYPGKTVQINVTIANEGASIENATLLVWFNTTVNVNNESKVEYIYIYNKTVTLQKFQASNSTREFSFTWDTSGYNLSSALYIISANITTARDDYLKDNSLSTTVQIIVILHDVGVLNVLIIPDTIYVGDTVNMAVIVKNSGVLPESFNVTVSINGEPVKRFENVSLPAGVGDILFLNTTFNKEGNYALNVSVSKVPGETNFANNFQATSLLVGFAQASILTPETIAIVIVTVLVVAALIVFLKKRY